MYLFEASPINQRAKKRLHSQEEKENVIFFLRNDVLYIHRTTHYILINTAIHPPTHVTVVFIFLQVFFLCFLNLITLVCSAEQLYIL